MPRIRRIQSSFSAGVLDPRLAARVDIKAFKDGAELLDNAICIPQGGVSRRPGLKYIGTIPNISASVTSDTRLIPFSFNTEQNYMIVASNLNLAIYKNGVFLVNVAVVYTSAQVNEINWTQSADTLIIVHPDVAPTKVVRDSANELIWTDSVITLTNVPQYDYGSGVEDVWSASRGWPRSVTFFEGRTVFGGSKSRPQGIWLSKTNDFYNFNVGTGLADEAIVGTLDTDQVNEIRNVVPGRTLEIYTSGAEFVVPDSPSTPANFAVARQTTFGSAAIRTASIDGASLFVQRNGQGFREFIFSFGEDAHVSNSVSQLSTHLINTPVDLSALSGTATTETNYVYLVNEAGDAVVLNTLREQEIAAWSGPWTTLVGEFKRVGVLADETYFIVERDIDGNPATYLEKLDESHYTDSSIYIASHSSATVTGLDHLEGEEVRVRLNGAIHPSKTVSSGSITLDRTPSAETVEAGLDFNPIIRTMPVSDEYADGPTLNREKRIVRATINRYQSLGIIVNGERIPDRTLDEDTFDAAPVPSDETVEIYLNGYSKKAQVTITQEDPMPLTILALDLEVSA